MKKTALNLYADARTRKRLQKLAERNHRSQSQEFARLVGEAWEKFIRAGGDGSNAKGEHQNFSMAA